MPAWLWYTDAFETQASIPDTGPETTDVHIIAHPDDDLYFINPQVQHALQAGRKVVSIYVTGGENDGRNGDVDQADYSGYVAARYEGLRAAYGDMTLSDSGGKWNRDTLELTDGNLAERATLDDAENVEMIFLNLWENSERQPGSNGKRLMDLWTGDTEEHHTLIASSSPIDESYSYTRDLLIETLADLLTEINPGCVRTLDPDPDPQVHDDDNPKYADQEGYSDHIDHTAVALFAHAAVEQWRSRGPQANMAIVESYRGYYNRRWPKNLSTNAIDEKNRPLAIYAWQDDRECGNDIGCGDLKIGGEPIWDHKYGASTILRYPADVSWWRCSAEGQLFGSTVHAGGAVRWVSSVDHTSWSQVMTPEKDTLLPGICQATVGADIWFEFAVRADFKGEPSDNIRHLVARRFAFGGAQGDWVDLGNPEDDDAERGRLLGSPSAVALADGRVMVAVRNFERGVSIRIHNPDGDWDDWTRLDGGDIIQDGLCTVSGGDAVAEIFGCAADGFAHWWYVDDVGWQYELLEVGGPVSTPTVVRLDDDRILLLSRQEDSAEVWAYLREGEEWTSSGSLGGDGGIGPIAAVAPPDWDGRVALAANNDKGTTSLAVLAADTESLEHDWVDGGPLTVRSPGITVDNDGRVAAAVLGNDGKLHVARNDSAKVELPTQWDAVNPTEQDG